MIRNNNKPIIMPVSKTGFPSVATSLYTTCPLSSLRVSMIHTGSSVHRLIFKLCFLSFYKTHWRSCFLLSLNFFFCFVFSFDYIELPLCTSSWPKEIIKQTTGGERERETRWLHPGSQIPEAFASTKRERIPNSAKFNRPHDENGEMRYRVETTGYLKLLVNR